MGLGASFSGSAPLGASNGILVADGAAFDLGANAAFTAAIWVRITDVAGGIKTFWQQAAAWRFRTINDQIQFQVYDSLAGVVSAITTSLNQDQWYFVVGTRSTSGDITLFIDNVEVDTTPQGDPSTFSTTADIELGGTAADDATAPVDVDAATFMTGVACSDEQVSKLWNGGDGRIYADVKWAYPYIVAWWGLDESIGTRLDVANVKSSRSFELVSGNQVGWVQGPVAAECEDLRLARLELWDALNNYPPLNRVNQKFQFDDINAAYEGQPVPTIGEMPAIAILPGGTQTSQVLSQIQEIRYSLIIRFWDKYWYLPQPESMYLKIMRAVWLASQESPSMLNMANVQGPSFNLATLSDDEGPYCVQGEIVVEIPFRVNPFL